MRTATIDMSALVGDKTAAIRRVVVRYLTVTLAILAFVVMGSESIWFPWPNVAALGVLAVIVWRVRKHDVRR